MEIRSKQEIEQERGELIKKIEVHVARLKRVGWQGYEGWVGVTQTEEQAWKESVGKHEWILRMLREIDGK